MKGYCICYVAIAETVIKQKSMKGYCVCRVAIAETVIKQKSMKGYYVCHVSIAVGDQKVQSRKVQSRDSSRKVSFVPMKLRGILLDNEVSCRLIQYSPSEG